MTDRQQFAFFGGGAIATHLAKGLIEDAEFADVAKIALWWIENPDALKRQRGWAFISEVEKRREAYNVINRLRDQNSAIIFDSFDETRFLSMTSLIGESPWGLSATFGGIFSPKVIGLFRGRLFNVHAAGYQAGHDSKSIPERYRGPGDRIWRTLSQDLDDGATNHICMYFHLVSSKIDEGVVVARSEPIFFCHKKSRLLESDLFKTDAPEAFVEIIGYHRLMEAFAQNVRGFVIPVLRYLLDENAPRPATMVFDRASVFELMDG